jgi:hypothetical protein
MKKKLTIKQKNSLLRILSSSITSRGKKSKGLTSSSNILENIYAFQKLSLKEIISHIEIKLYSILTSKTVYYRKNSNIIPVAMNSKQRNSKVVLRLLKAVQVDSARKSISHKMVDEINSVILNKNSKSLLAKDSEVKQAVLNRAKLRFRW